MFFGKKKTSPTSAVRAEAGDFAKARAATDPAVIDRRYAGIDEFLVARNMVPDLTENAAGWRMIYFIVELMRALFERIPLDPSDVTIRESYITFGIVVQCTRSLSRFGLAEPGWYVSMVGITLNGLFGNSSKQLPDEELCEIGSDQFMYVTGFPKDVKLLEEFDARLLAWLDGPAPEKLDALAKTMQDLFIFGHSIEEVQGEME